MNISWKNARDGCLLNGADLIDIDSNYYSQKIGLIKKVVNKKQNIYVC
jgi:hypothetical protein